MDKIERRELRRQLAAKAELDHGLARRAAGKTTSHLQDKLIAEMVANYGCQAETRGSDREEEDPPTKEAAPRRRRKLDEVPEPADLPNGPHEVPGSEGDRDGDSY